MEGFGFVAFRPAKLWSWKDVTLKSELSDKALSLKTSSIPFFSPFLLGKSWKPGRCWKTRRDWSEGKYNPFHLIVYFSGRLTGCSPEGNLRAQKITQDLRIVGLQDCVASGLAKQNMSLQYLCVKKPLKMAIDRRKQHRSLITLQLRQIERQFTARNKIIFFYFKVANANSQVSEEQR